MDGEGVAGEWQEAEVVCGRGHSRGLSSTVGSDTIDQRPHISTMNIFHLCATLVTTEQVGGSKDV